MVECLYVTSLLSLKSAVLADSPHIENILAIYLLLLVLSWLKASMFLIEYECFHVYFLHLLHVFMIIGSLDLYN